MANRSLIFANEYENISFQVSVLANETCKGTFFSIHFRQIDQIQKIRESLVPQRIVYKTDIFKKYLKKEK